MWTHMTSSLSIYWSERQRKFYLYRLINFIFQFIPTEFLMNIPHGSNYSKDLGKCIARTATTNLEYIYLQEKLNKYVFSAYTSVKHIVQPNWNSTTITSMSACSVCLLFISQYRKLMFSTDQLGNANALKWHLEFMIICHMQFRKNNHRGLQ